MDHPPCTLGYIYTMILDLQSFPSCDHNWVYNHSEFGLEAKNSLFSIFIYFHTLAHTKCLDLYESTTQHLSV